MKIGGGRVGEKEGGEEGENAIFNYMLINYKI